MGVGVTVPAAIVSCSEQAALAHQRLGYQGRKFTVIQNGYDLAIRPQQAARDRLRREWGIPSQMPLLGTVARSDPQKDHANLLSALALLATQAEISAAYWPARDRAVQRRVGAANFESGLEDKVLLLGVRDDIPDVMSALDLHVLSSLGEAFPNVVAEAMACGTPCAVTDVGDAASIVGSTGWVAAPRDAASLAQCMERALRVIQSSRREELSNACRQRIVECFGIERMVAAYKDVWLNCQVNDRNF